MIKRNGFRDFVKNLYNKYPTTPKNKEIIHLMESKYISRLNNFKNANLNEDCGCGRKNLSENVAREIFKQLGGNRFVAMTGAKHILDGGKYLSFKIPRAGKNGINYVKITSTDMDLYDIEFGRIHGNTYKVVKKVNGIYYDQLTNIFTEVTGLYTRL
jgi:hypothetical protein